MYVELHARSAFSFLQGASLPEELAAQAAKLEMGAMALVDRDGVYGAPRFHLAAQRAKIRPHVGAEILLKSNQRLMRLPLLAKSRAGYQNLCRLITRMKLRVPKHAPEGACSTDWGELAEFSEGLVALTGDSGGVLARMLTQGREAAKAELELMIAVLGRENAYVELQRHFLRDEEFRNQAAIEIARKLHLPLLATNGVCYCTPEQREVLDVFTCIHHKRTLATGGRLLEQNGERCLKQPQAMERLFADLPEAIASSSELSSRLEFTLKDLGYRFPPYPVPEGETMDSFLRARTYEGAQQRYRPLSESARRQLERELKLIEKLGLAGYFLIVWDIVCLCRTQGILVQGRGSAANSAVCYALGITAVDPIAMDLLFERFLSEERGEWPDIDLDLPSGEQREQVIQHVYERYGKLGAAMTANVITYRGRSAAREIGKVLGFKEEVLEKISGAIGQWEYMDPKDTRSRQFGDAGLDLEHWRIRKYLELTQRVQDLPRHLGQHSGGMVICQGQLDSVVPLEPAAMPGRVVVQWDKDDCADMGIIKVDLLGLGMMAALKESLELIGEHYGEEVDLAHLPQDDPEVYEAIRKADTVGMFQIESRAQISSLPRNNPRRFYDLVVQVALIRPGPIVGEMTSPYLARRQGKQEVTYPHPSLEPVLKRTLGVPLFQEQLLRMAMICANFTGGEAEELRRALGSKRSQQRMKEIGEKLRTGMTKNGIAERAQNTIVQFISSFALYGFPESHAASFALLAYASAYLKCHYLAAFTAALLNHQPMGFYSPAVLLKDAQRHGLKVRPIDVTCSEWACTLEGHKNEVQMRLGLSYVKGLHQPAGEAIVKERMRAAFRSIQDMAERVPELHKAELRTLAKVGALNRLEEGAHRRDALWQVEQAGKMRPPLFHGVAAAAEKSAMPLQTMDAEERLLADYSGTGLTTGPHPMLYRRAEMDARGIVRAGDLSSLSPGSKVQVAGAVIVRQRPGTAKGFVFLSLEDETGIVNAIVTPAIFEKYRRALTTAPFLIVQGELQNLEGAISIKASAVQPLCSQPATASHDFR